MSNYAEIRFVLSFDLLTIIPFKQVTHGLSIRYLTCEDRRKEEDRPCDHHATRMLAGKEASARLRANIPIDAPVKKFLSVGTAVAL